MAVKAHDTDERFELKELTLEVPHIQGQHTGETFAEKFNKVLKTYGETEKLFTITADQASTKQEDGKPPFPKAW